MDLIISTVSGTVKKAFNNAAKTGGLKVSWCDSDSIIQTVMESEENIFIYIDISEMDNDQTIALTNTLSNKAHARFGIIDPHGSVEDIAGLFFRGASDYIGKDMLKNGLSPDRLKKAAEFRGEAKKYDTTAANGKKKFILSGKDWQNIMENREYTFCFMFIMLEDQDIIGKKLGDGHLQKVLDAFMGIVAEKVSHVNGKLWLWSESGGLVLFPFDGKRCECIKLCIEMTLDRKIFSFEDFEFNTLINFRTVLHLGNTMYRKKGDTGNIISDSINAIFHLGHQADPGSCIITEELFDFIPPGLEDLFIDGGTFEKRRIRCLKNFL